MVLLKLDLLFSNLLVVSLWLFKCIIEKGLYSDDLF